MFMHKLPLGSKKIPIFLLLGRICVVGGISVPILSPWISQASLGGDKSIVLGKFFIKKTKNLFLAHSHTPLIVDGKVSVLDSAKNFSLLLRILSRVFCMLCEIRVAGIGSSSATMTESVDNLHKFSHFVRFPLTASSFFIYILSFA